MTPGDRQVIYGLTFVPGRGRQSSPEDVLRHFGTTDGHALGLRLLRDAVDRRDGTDADSALAVCGTFGITADHLGLLVQLASAYWHRRHEDVASASLIENSGCPMKPIRSTTPMIFCWISIRCSSEADVRVKTIFSEAPPR